MTSFTVISVPREMSAFAFAFLPKGGIETAGGGRIYRLFTTDGRTDELTYVDPFDGETLIDLHSFASIDEAKTWIQNDISMRSVSTRGVQ